MFGPWKSISGRAYGSEKIPQLCVSRRYTDGRVKNGPGGTRVMKPIRLERRCIGFEERGPRPGGELCTAWGRQSFPTFPVDPGTAAGKSGVFFFRGFRPKDKKNAGGSIGGGRDRVTHAVFSKNTPAYDENPRGGGARGGGGGLAVAEKRSLGDF